MLWKILRAEHMYAIHVQKGQVIVGAFGYRRPWTGLDGLTALIVVASADGDTCWEHSWLIAVRYLGPLIIVKRHRQLAACGHARSEGFKQKTSRFRSYKQVMNFGETGNESCSIAAIQVPKAGIEREMAAYDPTNVQGIWDQIQLWTI